MRGAALTVGSFDGVHRGHQQVLAGLVRTAARLGLESAALALDPHPLEIVNPAAAPRLLTVWEEKRALLEASGVDRVERLQFTPALSRLGPEEFTRDVLRAQYGMQALVLGHDHGFGRGRAGDVELLRTLGRADGFTVEVVDAVADQGQLVSSSLIRSAVAHGDFGAAARWLGRPYAIRGVVVAGAGRGRGLGVPTVNLAPPDPRKLLPPDGVYAVRVRWREGAHGGMMNQGPRPTFGITERGLEVHLFDHDGVPLGESVLVEWVHRLRDVQQFPSREALVAQLARDAVAARESLNR